MKKLLIGISFFILSIGTVSSQSVFELGSKIINSNFLSTEKYLQANGFELMTPEMLRMFGHNEKTRIIGLKGDNPNNSITVYVNLYNDKSVKDIKIICSKLYTESIESDFNKNGYTLSGKREYIEANKWKIIEHTLQKITEKHTYTLTIGYLTGGSGGAEVKLSYDVNIK